MAPNAVVIIPVNTVAGMGHDKFSSTLEKNFEKGVALSRASVHHVLPTVKKVPMRQGQRDRKIMKRSPNVASLLPVACAKASARGNDPLLFRTASRSVIP